MTERTPRVLTPSLAELRARRRSLLGRLGMTRTELGDEAAAGRLTGEAFWLYREIEATEFLLGDDG